MNGGEGEKFFLGVSKFVIYEKPKCTKYINPFPPNNFFSKSQGILQVHICLASGLFGYLEENITRFLEQNLISDLEEKITTLNVTFSVTNSNCLAQY